MINYIVENMNKEKINILIGHLTINGGKHRIQKDPTIGTVEKLLNHVLTYLIKCY